MKLQFQILNPFKFQNYETYGCLHLVVGTKEPTKKSWQNQLSNLCISFEMTLWLGFVINRDNGNTHWLEPASRRILEHQTN